MSLAKYSTPQKYLWVGWNQAGLDPAQFRVVPDNYESLVAFSQAVTAFRHDDDTWDMTRSKALRQEREELPVELGALLHALIDCEDDLNHWLWLSQSFHKDFQLAKSTTGAASFVSDLYRKAKSLVAENPPSVATLTEWSPMNSTLESAIGRIASVWNPYQVYWYITCACLSFEA